jgi:uncharacterized membrane protein YraQ (UPF0718 family)
MDGNPPREKAKIDWTIVGLLIVLAILAALSWWRGGLDLALNGLILGGETLLAAVPLLLAAFLIAGLVQAIVTRDMVTRLLGSQSGWRGLALACLGGALLPGGPYVYYPIAAALLKTGAGLGVLVAFVTAKNLWAVTRLPVELALLGPYLTLVRVAVTFVLPPLLGILAEWLFGHHVERIREEAP